MRLPDRERLVSRLCPPLDEVLTRQLVDHFVETEVRYLQGDWKPAELDGGFFCEALARIIYHQDSGNLKRNKHLNDCLDYVEDRQGQRPHKIQPRSDALHIARIIRSVYNFRSARGVAHLSPSYSANQMDSRFVLEAVRWCMNESLRVFGVLGHDRDEIARTVRELIRFEVPCIGIYENSLVVQRTDLTAEQEVLLLLHHAGEQGLTRRELGRHMGRYFAPPSVTRALQKLASRREIIALASDRWCLGDLGAKRVRENLADKLLLQ